MAVDEVLTVSPEDAARRAGISRSSLYNLIGSGEIVSFKCGRRRLVPVSALRAWIERQTEAHSAAR